MAPASKRSPSIEALNSFIFCVRFFSIGFRVCGFLRSAGDLKEDPILFALHDPVSYLVMVAMIAAVALATFARLSFGMFPQ
jgi:hypothetical protein